MSDAKKLTPEGYMPRLVENRLDALMDSFGCVEINGPKWCGKTWTARTRCTSMTKLDDPAEREAAEMDPSLALMGDPPHLVDEWQEVPEVWDAAFFPCASAALRKSSCWKSNKKQLSG